MLGIEFDSYAGESFYSDKMPSVLQELKDKGLMHESRGAQIVDLEDYGMPPAVITKSDGSSLYATRDIAAAIERSTSLLDWLASKMVRCRLVRAEWFFLRMC